MLDIVPTGEVWARADATFALGYWHWAFLAQPAPLPERLISGDPDAFWIAAERMGLKPGDPRYPDEVVAAYRAQLDDPARDRDLRGLPRGREHRPRARRRRPRPRDDRLPGAPLWGARGGLPRFYEDPLEPWRALAPTITGRAIEGASHFLVEDAPEEVAAELTTFFSAPPGA